MVKNCKVSKKVISFRLGLAGMICGETQCQYQPGGVLLRLNVPHYQDYPTHINSFLVGLYNSYKQAFTFPFHPMCIYDLVQVLRSQINISVFNQCYHFHFECLLNKIYSYSFRSVNIPLSASSSNCFSFAGVFQLQFYYFLGLYQVHS